MDQRREPRFQTDQSVVLTVLNGHSVRISGRVKDASSRGLGLRTEAPVEPGAAVRIEADDAILLGEAIFCRSDLDGHFVGVELDQMLVGLTELSRALSDFAPDGAGAWPVR
jgi:hypothetical protein